MLYDFYMWMCRVISALNKPHLAAKSLQSEHFVTCHLSDESIVYEKVAIIYTA